MPPTTAQQGINYCTPLSRFRMTNEQPIAFSKCAWPNAVLNDGWCRFPIRRRPQTGSGLPTVSKHNQWLDRAILAVESFGGPTPLPGVAGTAREGLGCIVTLLCLESRVYAVHRIEKPLTA